MGAITHAVVATGVNNPSKQISKDAWNDGHVIDLDISDINGLSTALDGKVDTSTTVNGHALTGDIIITYGDVGALGNAASGAHSLAISEPENATAAGDYAVAIGYSASASGNYSIAIGNTASAAGVGSISLLGVATNDNSTALGVSAQATADGATALGAYAVGDVANAVSVGFTGGEKRIVHLADGVDPTDAATVGQLPSPGASPPFDDATALVKGSVDATKLFRFEVDGLSAGTTRVATVPNADFTMAGLSLTQTWTGQNTFAAGTLTASTPAQWTQTWNSSGVTFTALDLNVTNTASAAGSMLQNLRVGGTSVFAVGRANTNANPILMLGGDTGTGWYRNTADQWTWTTAGTARLSLLAGLVRLSSTTVIGVSSGASTSAIDVSMLRAGANSWQFGGNASAAGAATSDTIIRKLVSSIADATATAVFTVTVPNAAHNASIEVTLDGALGAGGAIGAGEAVGVIKYVVSVVRTAGVNAVANISTGFGSTTSSVAGAATITVTGDLSAISGAVGATNTFTIRVTITKGSGSSANHTCTARAELLNANASGITIA